MDLSNSRPVVDAGGWLFVFILRRTRRSCFFQDYARNWLALACQHDFVGVAAPWPAGSSGIGHSGVVFLFIVDVLLCWQSSSMLVQRSTHQSLRAGIDTSS
ncbi:hypothetical protein RESH_00949 [Rhodopirellula europaea SH398]|uniref:Uncharacterized protein n=1 Tax=Rhodopirellula europaea SH398 TaxID=1263868 RepID=M5SQE2_9BACT|nr:hypothetical protein RESH_00949 [Rhodopirellula europaea SH398]